MSNAKRDSNELLDLCGKVRDGSLTHGDQTRLEALLLADPKAMTYYRQFMAVCSGLEQINRLSSSEPLSELADLPFDELLAYDPKTKTVVETSQSASISPASTARKPHWVRFVALATAASLLVAVGISLVSSPKHATSDSIAVIVDEFQSRWSSDANILKGTSLAAGHYKLESGASQIRFANGAELLVQAPAVFSLDSQKQATLQFGSLTLFAPPTAKGFRIDSPHGSVVDLGTRIGILIDETDFEVHVFEGRAEATASESSTKILMNAGDAVAIVKSPNTAAVVNRISANEAYFSKSIESMNHLPIVNGDIELLTSPPRSVRRIASELVDLGRASLFAEQQSIELTGDLSVTWTDPGRCPELEGLNQTIAAGTRVDSFLVSFTMPRKLRRSKEHVTADGTIKFDRPVLGIICFEPGKVDSALQAPSTTYPGDRRTGLEDMIDGNPAWADQILLSDDRQTLSFHLDLHGRDAARQEDFIDQFRVLVQSQPSP